MADFLGPLYNDWEYIASHQINVIDINLVDYNLQV